MGEQQISVEQAAVRLGISKWATYKAINRRELVALPGAGPARLDAAEVERFIAARRTAAIERLTARGVDVVQLAKDTRHFLRPPIGAPSPGGVSKVGAEVMAFFGPAALTAAAIQDPSVCGWCATTIASRMLGAPMPAYSKAYVALLGPPCAKDRAVVDAELERQRVQVYAGAQRPSRARTAPAAAPRPVLPRPSAQTAVQRPVQAARGSLPDPTAAASWRSTTAAAARPAGWPYFVGNKVCGTPVGTPCSCHPPRAVTASVKAKPVVKRAGVHACGCTCTRCAETSR